MHNLDHIPLKTGDVFAFSGGFFTQKRIRRIMQLAGVSPHLGWPSAKDHIAIWGQTNYAKRGARIAAKTGSPLLHVEDPWLRSLHLGRAGQAPHGLLIDQKAMHFDPTEPSDLETLLATHPLDDAALLRRAEDARHRIAELNLTKYSATRTDIAPPEPGYVLVIDQSFEDASVRASKGNRALFQEMLVLAQEEHPGCRVLIKTHPETAQGHRIGYFGVDDVTHRVTLYDENISPQLLFEGAVGVYTVSSQLGFEAIFSGHKPVVMGQPFYSGWGLTDDRNPVPRRERKLSRNQLFSGAMMLYPIWYDVHGDTLCNLETVIENLGAETRAWREDRLGYQANGMRLWKRRHLQNAFGGGAGLRFNGVANDARPSLLWGGPKIDTPTDFHLEDGFIRSKGLGAHLTPPLSLIRDAKGMYFDPEHPSEIEDWIARRDALCPTQKNRAAALISHLIQSRVSKYNLPQSHDFDFGDGVHVVVVGQVDDDASVLCGAAETGGNLGLLKAARAHFPAAKLHYKPHPDVEAGLRCGQLSEEVVLTYADSILTHQDPIAVIEAADHVATMTSLLGFEALLRGVPVTCFGMPFYGGWGLTTDLMAAPARRKARPSLEGLVYAALIDYPRYFNPETGEAWPIEAALAHLETAPTYRGGTVLKLLSKLQGAMASYSHLWR
ncbi:MAG: capsular polysaccharide biosynthesis protein [Halocynthiibacter sp.]